MIWKQRLLKFVHRAALSVPVTIAFFDCVAYVAKVEGVSMQPTLNPDTNHPDFVLLNRWVSRTCKVKRGDVIAITSPRDPSQKLIKRIIALEGDVVRTLSYKKRFVTVPAGHCWIEGDNSTKSLDSNTFGPIALGLLVASATYIVWPPSRWGQLESFVPDTRKPAAKVQRYWTMDPIFQENE
ncbi:mitochondrial inner membrane protease subunit 2-like [Ornithodoros turicata]|uniref:mitochondrial inner membrane protease subunit 2-like n=1 Tax=Ornithodoros turicata TaxID=34597 RepID=UPI00313A3130